MPVLIVEHVTTYRYRRVVGFGEHRMMFRPRDSVDQRILDWSLTITPRPIELRSVCDPFGNLVSIARFAGRARELSFTNRLVIDHTPVEPKHDQLAPYARSWPFTYSQDDAADLGRVRERRYDDRDHVVDAWARGFLHKHANGSTLDLLIDMTREIRRSFTYSPRYEEGVQEPARTLALRNGTCRDYAVLMMEAVRSLGLASRFVSGYVYSPGADGTAHIGGGSTHAWVEVFLPGLGWTEFDPTNAIIGTRDLIRVASVRDWHQAVPLSGTWTGFPADSLGMSVSVTVSQQRDQTGKEAAGPGEAATAEAAQPQTILSAKRDQTRPDAATPSPADRSPADAL
ncbi:transglutaminase family protein [Acetobacteraceae bacterium KSS8]|uniref:Transglutaminase family protein n=1 Tax=Endosaccharibacter trunci TaxID=2812733 RepID=A0ABT1W2T0_9PROT|nr:transglutaminase family protein [Acetobacteraceae bacterium KSS8]